MFDKELYVEPQYKDLPKMQRLLALLHYRLTLVEHKYTVTDPTADTAAEECAKILLRFPAEVTRESHLL